MHGDAEAVTLRQLAAPFAFLRRQLGDTAEPPGVDGIGLEWLAVVPPILRRFADVDDARRTDQLDEDVLGIAAERMRDFRDHGLDRKGMRYVRDGAEPADPRMRRCFRVLAPDVRNREGHVDKSLAELDRTSVLRLRRECRAQ